MIGQSNRTARHHKPSLFRPPLPRRNRGHFLLQPHASDPRRYLGLCVGVTDVLWYYFLFNRVPAGVRFWSAQDARRRSFVHVLIRLHCAPTPLEQLLRITPTGSKQIVLGITGGIAAYKSRQNWCACW